MARLQLAPAANVAPQVLALADRVKAAEPLSVEAAPLSAAVPTFDKVTDSVLGAVLMATLPNDNAAGLRVASGPGTALPVPVSASVWTPFEASDCRLRLAACVPIAFAV
jgi:hypothetical protein